MDSLEVKGRSERLEEKLCTDFVLSLISLKMVGAYSMI
jgi:hypothetical protein